MEPEKNTPQAENTPTNEQQAPADALSRTPEELDEEASHTVETVDAAANPQQPAEKKVSPLKKLFRKINVYFLIFLLLVAVGGAIAIVNYLNSQKAPSEATIAAQSLSQETLKQLANTDATVGSASQTLTIQGNAIIAGQSLLRGNLNVAGNLQTGGSITGPSITISGQANLGPTQINSLQVAANTAIQGTTTLRDLNVAGTSSFSGPVTASQLTVSRLIMSGNAVLQIPNHISFTGASPTRTITASTLGSGGSASVNGSDTTGTVNINTGGSPATGCFIRITFQEVFSNQPHVIITPIGAVAGQLSYYVDRDKSGFSICTNNAAAANQVFAFDYFVTN